MFLVNLARYAIADSIALIILGLFKVIVNHFQAYYIKIHKGIDIAFFVEMRYILERVLIHRSPR
ncbi:MAG: hypothetical protein D6728_10800 [Cyanobacteria bacterium J055]|nr:MAG: hypothetical protein D6728_10800 [Cyanobacteria bacterium J055]